MLLNNFYQFDKLKMRRRRKLVASTIFVIGAVVMIFGLLVMINAEHFLLIMLGSLICASGVIIMIIVNDRLREIEHSWINLSQDQTPITVDAKARDQRFERLEMSLEPGQEPCS